MKKINKLIVAVLSTLFCLSSCNNVGHEKLSSLYPWINELKLDDIETVLSYEDWGSIPPHYYSLNIYRIGNENDKKSTYDFLKKSTVYEDEDPLWAGVGERALIIKLKDGATHRLSHIGEGFYVNDKYYKYTTFPSFVEYYGNSFLPHCTFSLFQEENLIKENVNEMRNIVFFSVLDDYVQQDKYVPYTIRMGDEKINIVDYRTFYIINRNNQKKYYQILNDYSFDDILAIE